MKKINRTWFFRATCLAGIIFLFNGCIKNLTQQSLVYFNDFEGEQLRGLEVYTTTGPLTTGIFQDFNGSKVLGRFNNNTIQVTLLNLPTHNAMTIEMTLYVHDKWDGNFIGPTHVPDIWQMAVDGNALLITTFSNSAANTQSYPNFYQNGKSLPAKTNSIDSALLGVCSLQGVSGGTSSYRIVKTFPHTTSGFTFQCNDALQPFNSLCLKSWSIDDLKITAIKY